MWTSPGGAGRRRWAGFALARICFRNPAIYMVNRVLNRSFNDVSHRFKKMQDLLVFAQQVAST
jgi:hypothetical protein